jgi:hypothetical protein
MTGKRLGKRMSYVSRIVAVVSGIVLYTASVYLLSAIPIQTNYSDLVGNGFLADTVINAARRTLPFFILSLALSWITLRWLARPPRIAVWWCIGGLIVGFPCWEVFSSIQSYNWCLDWNLQYRSEPSYYYSLPECSILAPVLRRFFWDAQNFFSILSGLAAAGWLVLRSERIAMQNRGIMNAREVILVTVVAFVCGVLGGSIWASSAKSEEVTVNARNNGNDEWTSTHLKVRGGELIEVYASGSLNVRRSDNPRVQQIYPSGTHDGLGRLDMRVGNAAIGYYPGFGQWIQEVYEPGIIQFRIRGNAKDEMSGRYHVQVVVVPRYMTY